LGATGKDAGNADRLGNFGELGFNFGLVLGDLDLLRLYFFDEGEKFLVVFGSGCLRRDRGRCHQGNERKGQKKFHREKMTASMK
jgi:hypothetical protein